MKKLNTLHIMNNQRLSKVGARLVGSYGEGVGMNNFQANLEVVKNDLPENVYKYISTCEQAQDIVDALHIELYKKYNDPMDWLISTFFVRVQERRINFWE